MAAKLEIVTEAKDRTKRGLRSSERNVNNLEKAVKGAAASMAVAFGAKQVFDIARLGATAERVEKRFEAFSGGAERAAKMLDAFQDGAGGAASKLTAMEEASRLLQMGLVGNADEMELITEMAVRLGEQTQSVSERTQNFALMLANTSVPRLDSFGISAGTVRQKMQDLQEQMSITREEAFKLAVMEEGAKSLEILGERSDDSLQSFELLEAKTEDLKVVFGKGLAPILVTTIDLFIQLLEHTTPLLEMFAEMTGGVQEFGKVQADAATATKNAFEDMSPALLSQQWATFSSSFVEANESMGGALGVLAGWLPNTIDQYDLLENAMGAMNKAIIANSDSYSEYLRLHDAVNASTDSALMKVPRLSKAEVRKAIMLRTTAAVTEDMRKAQARLNREEEISLNQTDLMWQGLSSATPVLNEYNQRVRDGAEARYEQNDAIRLGVIELDNEWLAAKKIDEARIERQEAERAEAEERKQRAEDYKRQTEERAQAAEEAAAREIAALEQAVKAQADLMLAVQDATAEQVNQKLLSMVDPNEVGIEAWAGLGQELGLLDQAAVDIATSLPELVDAFTESRVPTEDMAELMGAVYKNAGDADFAIGPLIEKFEKAPEVMQPVNSDLEKMGPFIGEIGDNLPPATENLEGFTEMAFNAIEPIAGTWKTVHDLNYELEKATEKTWKIYVETYYRTFGAPGPDPGQPDSPDPEPEQMGGRIPGLIGQPVPVLAHGGEVWANPYQYGAVGGPGGPPAPRSIGGTGLVQNVFINDRATYAWWKDQQRRGRFDGYSKRVRGR